MSTTSGSQQQQNRQQQHDTKLIRATAGNQVLLPLVANYLVMRIFATAAPVSTTYTGGKIATGVNDTGGK